MQSSHQAEPEDGRWLCAEGPYRDYIAAWCGVNPNLRSPDSKNRWSPLKTGNARVVKLEIKQGEGARRTDFLSAADLRADLFTLGSTDRPAQQSSIGRIYIMEGLAPDYIAALGDHFFMDPRFFMDQERTTSWGLSHEGDKKTMYLPSLISPEKMVVLKYSELRDFGLIQTFSMWCARTSRSISITSNTRPDLYDLRFEPVGIVHRKCSFWSKGDENGWFAIILCDPQVEDVFIQTENTNIDRSIGSKYSKWLPKSPHQRTVPNTAFSGGYVDFVKHPEQNQNMPKGPPRTSMLDDLCFYWTNYGPDLEENSGLITAFNANIFMKKIVASHYIQLIAFVRGNIYNIEYQLSRRKTISEFPITWIEERWSDVQSRSLRCSEYIEDVEAIMMCLGIPFATSSALANNLSDWKRCDIDFQYIHHRFKELKGHLDVVNNSITGLAGIAGNQQALREAKRSLKEAKAIKTLTVLGMIFIPLAFCNGLFSMNDQYLPGKSSFWIYWAVSIPLIVAVFLVAFLINLGYDSAGGWDIVTLLQTISQAKGSSVIYTVSADNMELKKKGRLMDVVKQLADDPPNMVDNHLQKHNMNYISKWQKWCQLGLSLATYPTGESAKEALLPTLCNDMSTSTDNNEVRRAPGEYQDHFDAWYKILTTPGLDAKEIKARMMEDNSLSRFYYQLLDEDVERELCITENVYMALVSEDTQLGDRIALLSGGRLPLVLRPLGSYHIVVGPCYVHGIVDGEAFPETESEMEWITLR